MIPTPHSIDLLKSGGLNIWGEPTEGVEIPLQGNIRSQSKFVRNRQGQEVVSEYTVLFIGVVDITHEDKIRFVEPNGEVKEYQPITIKFMRDLDGTAKFTKVVV